VCRYRLNSCAWWYIWIVGLLWIWLRHTTLPKCLTAGRLSATKEEISPCSLQYSIQFTGLFYGGYRTRWQRGLRCGSAAARLLGSRVRMPQGYGCLSIVSVECCQVEFSAWGSSFVQRIPTECDESVIVKPQQWRGPGPLGAVEIGERNFIKMKRSWRPELHR